MWEIKKYKYLCKVRKNLKIFGRNFGKIEMSVKIIKTIKKIKMDEIRPC